MSDEYFYGIRARVNCGFGLWQLAFGSKAELNSANLRAAYNAMAEFAGDKGHKLGIAPTHIVVGANNYFKARDILLTANIGGSTNTDFDLVKIIKSSV
jgi:phage major head subunit gpT-like protein